MSWFHHGRHGNPLRGTRKAAGMCPLIKSLMLPPRISAVALRAMADKSIRGCNPPLCLCVSARDIKETPTVGKEASLTLRLTLRVIQPLTGRYVSYLSWRKYPPDLLSGRQSPNPVNPVNDVSRTKKSLRFFQTHN